MIETAHDLHISALCVNNLDKHIVYTGSRDYSVKIWDISRGSTSSSTHG